MSAPSHKGLFTAMYIYQSMHIAWKWQYIGMCMYTIRPVCNQIQWGTHLWAYRCCPLLDGQPSHILPHTCRWRSRVCYNRVDCTYHRYCTRWHLPSQREKVHGMKREKELASACALYSMYWNIQWVVHGTLTIVWKYNYIHRSYIILLKCNMKCFEYVLVTYVARFPKCL